MSDPSILTQESVVRIYHSVNLVRGCTATIGESVDVTMFKTIKITGGMNCGDIISILAQKLALGDDSQYNLYSLDTQLNSSKSNSLFYCKTNRLY